MPIHTPILGAYYTIRCGDCPENFAREKGKSGVLTHISGAGRIGSAVVGSVVVKVAQFG
jgi:hypothetical protein